MVGQLGDGPASRAPVLSKDNQLQASNESGVGVMPKQHRRGWGAARTAYTCNL